MVRVGLVTAVMAATACSTGCVSQSATDWAQMSPSLSPSVDEDVAARRWSALGTVGPLRTAADVDGAIGDSGKSRPAPERTRF